MVAMKDIRAFARGIAEEFKPKRIILFGSYAYGKPTADSDVDLLVVMPYKGHPTREVIAILQQVQHPPFPLDLLVRSAAEMRKRYRLEDWFIREIVDKGKVLYESGNTKADGQSRS